MAYTRTIWQKGDVIDAEKLGNIENGIFAALNTLENLTGTTYDSTKIEKNQLVPEQLSVKALTVGNSSALSENSTRLYTNTYNFGNFQVGTENTGRPTTLYGELTVNRTGTDGSYTTVIIDADTTLKHQVNILGPLTTGGSLTVGSEQVSKNTTLYGNLTARGNITLGTATIENNVTTYINTATFNANTTFNGNTIANGTLTIKNPTANLHAATKQYVDNIISNLDQTTITGFGPSKTLASLAESDGIISATFQDIEIAESQVTNLTAHLNAKAPLASPTFTGTVTLAQAPQTSLEAATKEYVDNSINTNLTALSNLLISQSQVSNLTTALSDLNTALTNKASTESPTFSGTSSFTGQVNFNNGFILTTQSDPDHYLTLSAQQTSESSIITDTENYAWTGVLTYYPNDKQLVLGEAIRTHQTSIYGSNIQFHLSDNSADTYTIPAAPAEDGIYTLQLTRSTNEGETVNTLVWIPVSEGE